MKYEISSIKTRPSQYATYREALAAARAVAREYQPAYGVDITRLADGVTVRTVGR